MYKLYISLLIYLSLTNTYIRAIRKYTKQDLTKLREEVREMFDHAYSGYIKYAYPYDELRPLTCDGIDTWGSYSLTLIDALDTLAVMGNYSEFRRVVDIVTATANFDANINVSVFETNIRIVGGLLSAHLFSQRAGIKVEPGWPCNGPLLRLAEDVAHRLLPAFNTKTGMPLGTVNLRYGVPSGETPVTCTAGVGTFILEFATLSRLTGDPIYEEVAMNALRVLFQHRSPIGLFGNHIDVMTGRWIARDSGIGAGVDSYLEYLVKGSILLNRPELMAMFAEARRPIDKYLRKNHWYVWASMHKGQVTLPVFQSLEAYWPGVLTLIGDIESALRSMHNYNSVWKQYGFTPEFYNIAQGEAGTNRESYPLRPELAESAMYLYRATGDPFMLDIGLNILRSIQHSAKTPCGYATIKDTRDHTQENRMESFFLAETTKYLYLLFDPDNFIHNKGEHGRVHTLPSGKQCILDSGGYIFNTEAHAIDPGALNCCYDWDQQDYNNANSFNFIGESLKQNNKMNNQDSINQNDVSHTERQTEINEDDVTIDNEAKHWNDETKSLDINEEKSGDEMNENEVVRDNDDIIIGEERIGDDYGNTESNHVGNEGVGAVRQDKLLANVSNDEGNSQDNITSSSASVSLTKENEPTFHQNDDSPAAEENPWTESNLSETPSTESQSSLSSSSSSSASEVITLSDYVRQLVLTVPSTTNQFDAQQMLQNIRETSAYYINETYCKQYQLLTCKAQPFLIRITIAGEFLNGK
ncbi:hypothetical protein O3M35_006820 [Rhynocoris fuscipes]|uniref:alpha-1,2-Mannosidase n=1 Tax=Rhynocoris fuscipes TaxID=488301 RepID=A0AAW1DF38_9HEMI